MKSNIVIKNLLATLILFSIVQITAQANDNYNKPPEDVAPLIAKAEQLNKKCRLGSGDDQATLKACDERELIFKQIEAKNWCWGGLGQEYGYQKQWQACVPNQVKVTEAIFLDECIDAKVSEFRKENGEEQPINNDVLEEWKAQCKGLNSQNENNLAIPPGSWQANLTVYEQDPSTGKFKKVTQSSSRPCFTQEILSKDPFLTPGIEQANVARRNAKCEISDPKRNANSASWKMSCSMPDGSLSESSISNEVLSATKINSEITTVIKQGNQQKVGKILMDYNYIGDCTDKNP